MDKLKQARRTDFDNLVAIQRELLEESKRLRLLTAWLLALTAALIGISMTTVVAAL